MGICSKAKDIIYSSKLCDVNLKPKEKEGDNIIINSIPNTNNNTFNVDNNIINVVNINNQIINNGIKNEISEENKKICEDNSQDNKNKNGIDNHFNKKLKRKKHNYNKSSKKLVFKSSKDVLVKFKIESDIHNLDKSQNENNYNNNNNENSQIKNSDEKGEKFKRRSQKRGGTHIHNLPERLRGIEMSIPVFQESLITQNFGNPEKYYKKVRNLGSGSYGTVYLAKNTSKDNLVAIKVIEKIPANIIDFI